MEWSVAAVLAALAAVLLLWWLRSLRAPLQHWARMGVPQHAPFSQMYRMMPVLRGQVSFSELLTQLTEPFHEHGFCGSYQWATPMLLVWNPEMAKQVLAKEFSSLHDRGQPMDEKGDPMTVNLVNLGGARWRILRNKLSPTFTSGKLKHMFPLMREVAHELGEAIRAESMKEGGEVELYDPMTRFATDVIGTCAFGIRCNSLRNKDSEFLVMSREMFKSDFRTAIRVFLLSLFPQLQRLFRFKRIFARVHDFFVSLMTETVEYRRKNKVERGDFVDLMMRLQEADLTEEDREQHIELTHSVMTAQAIVFFVAGLDSFANTVSFCLNELAHAPELQRRVAGEVHAVLDRHGGELSYEALQEMDLVTRVVKEGLRLWSPVRALVRKCNKKVVIGDVEVDVGQQVMIITDRMHKSPELYPEPERFDPERFTGEAAAARHPYAFLPFGEGPRVCIAERFAMLEMRLALAALLATFRVSPGPRTRRTPQLDPKSLVPQAKGGFWLRVEPLRGSGGHDLQGEALPGAL